MRPDFSGKMETLIFSDFQCSCALRSVNAGSQRGQWSFSGGCIRLVARTTIKGTISCPIVEGFVAFMSIGQQPCPITPLPAVHINLIAWFGDTGRRLVESLVLTSPTGQPWSTACHFSHVTYFLQSFGYSKLPSISGHSGSCGGSVVVVVVGLVVVGFVVVDGVAVVVVLGASMSFAGVTFIGVAVRKRKSVCVTTRGTRLVISKASLNWRMFNFYRKNREVDDRTFMLV